jgi:hypothetical protein
MEIKRYITFRNKKNNFPMLKEKEKIQWDSDFSSYNKVCHFLNLSCNINIIYTYIF